MPVEGEKRDRAGRARGRGEGLWHLSCYIEIARSTGGVGVGHVGVGRG